IRFGSQVWRNGHSISITQNSYLNWRTKATGIVAHCHLSGTDLNANKEDVVAASPSRFPVPADNDTPGLSFLKGSEAQMSAIPAVQSKPLSRRNSAVTEPVPKVSLPIFNARGAYRYYQDPHQNVASVAAPIVSPGLNQRAKIGSTLKEDSDYARLVIPALQRTHACLRSVNIHDEVFRSIPDAPKYMLFPPITTGRVISADRLQVSESFALSDNRVRVILCCRPSQIPHVVLYYMLLVHVATSRIIISTTLTPNRAENRSLFSRTFIADSGAIQPRCRGLYGLEAADDQAFLMLDISILRAAKTASLLVTRLLFSADETRPGHCRGALSATNRSGYGPPTKLPFPFPPSVRVSGRFRVVHYSLAIRSKLECRGAHEDDYCAIRSSRMVTEFSAGRASKRVAVCWAACRVAKGCISASKLRYGVWKCHLVPRYYLGVVGNEEARDSFVFSAFKCVNPETHNKGARGTLQKSHRFPEPNQLVASNPQRPCNAPSSFSTSQGAANTSWIHRAQSTANPRPVTTTPALCQREARCGDVLVFSFIVFLMGRHLLQTTDTRTKSKKTRTWLVITVSGVLAVIAVGPNGRHRSALMSLVPKQNPKLE
ncbi:hypothetical protein BDZ89DRAFT_1055374, partial [Hymenopellis radicata]